MACYRRSGGRWSFPESVYTQFFPLYSNFVVPGASLAFPEDLSFRSRITFFYWKPLTTTKNHYKVKKSRIFEPSIGQGSDIPKKYIFSIRPGTTQGGWYRPWEYPQPPPEASRVKIRGQLGVWKSIFFLLKISPIGMLTNRDAYQSEKFSLHMLTYRTI